MAYALGLHDTDTARMMTYTTTVPLRWSDLDAVGHVNNAVYLTLCEQCRIEAFESLGAADWSESGPVIVAVSIQYLRPITVAGDAEVSVTFGAPGRTSIPTTHDVRFEGETCATAEITIVWVDHATGRPTPVPELVRERLAEG
ncbi:acyl-CoA thioesterase [Rubrivirga sp.]|uniref:acyl-CoA thioesterase n=1 Tax=Rubrivirga sp. TaxID=1885344 RepID=UPI003C7819BF